MVKLNLIEMKASTLPKFILQNIGSLGAKNCLLRGKKEFMDRYIDR